MKKKSKRQILTMLFRTMSLLFLFCNFPVSGYAAKSPTEQLREGVSAIVAILRRDIPGEQWVVKKQEITGIVKSRFDAEELAQRVLARNWRARTEEEKRVFVSLFSQVLETTYINKLKSYSDEEVIFKKEIVNNEKAVVYSEIVKNNQEIPIIYRVKNTDGQWLIYDIVIEGVSLVQNYRQQFDQIIKSEGYEGLVSRMEEKIRENRKKDFEETE